MRRAFAQVPHFRTGTPSIVPAGPTEAERKAITAIANAQSDRITHLARNGITFPVGYLPDPLKQQAKKIRQVLEHHAGIV